MQVSQTLGNGTVVTAEAETIIELWEQLSKLTEVFGEPDAVKGSDVGKDLVHRVRKQGKFKFYELYCPSLKAKLEFGVGDEENKGNLYPKRMKTGAGGKAVKDDNGKGIYLPDRGWIRWNRETGQNE
jgi:hypothetical protein